MRMVDLIEKKVIMRNYSTTRFSISSMALSPARFRIIRCPRLFMSILLYDMNDGKPRPDAENDALRRHGRTSAHRRRQVD
jgi:hypothetical protein